MTSISFQAPRASSNLARHVLIFLLPYLASQTLVRVALAFQGEAPDVWRTVRAFLVGMAFDLIAFAYALPLLLVILWSTRLWRHRRVYRPISLAFYATYLFALLFGAVSEWIFWDEFSVRFNFIAVDYLIYTKEVVANIWESYPVGWIVLGLALLGLAGALMLARLRLASPSTSHRQYLAGITASVLVAVAAYAGISQSLVEDPENRFTAELSKNGPYSLIHAFVTNELSYDQFYAEVSSEAMRKQLQAALDLPQTSGALSLHRKIEARGLRGTPPNVVLLTVESLGANFLGAYGSKKKLTPNLDALAKSSLRFANIQAIGTRTVFGLAGLTLSIPPIPGNSIVRRPGNEHLVGIGETLNEQGYVSTFFYGGFGYFDNMNAFFAGNGYRIIDRAQMEDDEITFANAWGVADEDIYARVLKENDRTHAEGKPFFNMILTTSNHRPYTFPEGRINLRSGSGREGAVKYTDYAIGRFLDQARLKPWFANTIFVIVGDHTASSAGKSALDPTRYHIPFLVYAPGLIKPGIDTTLASQIDVVPTILGFLGTPYDSHFYGVDLMAADPERAFVSNYQQLGYLTRDWFVVLKPEKVIATYRRVGEQFRPDSNCPPHLVQLAVAYFQAASQWKQLNKNETETKAN